jgi:pimeloyl-ACP methyl ester carboxylesterase
MAPLEGDVTVGQLGPRGDRILFPLSARGPALAREAVWAAARAPASVTHRTLLRNLAPPDRDVVAAMSPVTSTADFVRAVDRGCAGVVDDYRVLAAPWGFDLAFVHCPVAVFEGARDTLWPLSHAKALAGRLLKGELVVVPDAGHFLLHSHTDLVLERLAG